MRRLVNRSLGSPEYGEEIVSWLTVWDRLYPDPEDWTEPHDDAQAAEMQRLKGLVLGQAAEVENALAHIFRRLKTGSNPWQMTMGQLVKAVANLLCAEEAARWAKELTIIGRAAKSRNRVAHNPVRIGSSWEPSATGRGEWIAVIGMLGANEYGEWDLRRDLALQQEATKAAVSILHAISDAEIDAG